MTNILTENAFTDRLRSELKQRQMTYKVFAEYLGVSFPFVSDVMNNNRVLSEDRALKVCQEFGIDPDVYYVSRGQIPGDLLLSLSSEQLVAAIKRMREG